MTLRIDDQLAQLASLAAAAQGKTLDEYVGDILRHALGSGRPATRNGILVMQVPHGTPAIDPGRVRRQLEEDGS